MMIMSKHAHRLGQINHWLCAPLQASTHHQVEVFGWTMLRSPLGFPAHVILTGLS